MDRKAEWRGLLSDGGAAGPRAHGQVADTEVEKQEKDPTQA